MKSFFKEIYFNCKSWWFKFYVPLVTVPQDTMQDYEMNNITVLSKENHS